MNLVPALRWCGAAGLAGSALLLAADWTMLGTLTSGMDFKERWYVLLAEMPQWRLTIGALAGPIGAWLYVVGFWQVALALWPGGKRIAFAAFAGLSMSFVWIAAGFHTSFPFLAAAWQAREAATGEGAVSVHGIVERAFDYAGLIYYLGMAPALVGSLLLAYAVVFRRTRYPRWFAALNPMLLFALTLPFQWVPAPLGGLLVIGAGNLVFLGFFAVSTALLWNGGNVEPAASPRQSHQTNELSS